MKIIGVGGTNGSGKDTVGHMLAERHGWLFVNVSLDLFTPELNRRGLPVDRKHMSDLTTQWRRDDGMGAVVDKSLKFLKEQSQTKEYRGVVIGSLRHPGEADRIHELGGKVVWTDADPKVRYKRIFGRGQGEKDQKSYEEFLAEQEREMRHSGDEATLSIADVKAKADIFIENNENNIGAFKDQAEAVLKAAKLL